MGQINCFSSSLSRLSLNPVIELLIGIEKMKKQLESRPVMNVTAEKKGRQIKFSSANWVTVTNL